ncbi:TGS domain-containing protein [candidate division KSB1 bacterium]|nr:TGS domain-containing protein [candidate division KSB1 bacterium]
MPANLTPQYLAAEKKYKLAASDHDRLEALKEMLAVIPKHKGTDHLQGDIKRKIARLKEELQKSGKGAKHHFRYHVDREGLPQLALVGPPNVGKSQLLAALTHATPEIAGYPFTTRLFLPGVMWYENFQLQLVDLPPVSREFMEFWVPEVIKNADGGLLLLDLSAADPLAQLETTQEILKEYRLFLIGNERPDDPYRPETYLKTMIVGNKSDLPQARDNWQVITELYQSQFQMCPISALTHTNLNELKRQCIAFLNLIRVYAKPPGKEIDRSKPFIFKKGSTLLNFAQSIHLDFAEHLKFARVWGATKFNGQRVNRDYILADEDIIELHI